MAVPGWYRDPGSDRLARWFDGEEWTHHTVVMADWRGRGTPPPPEDRTIVQSSEDAYIPPPSGDWAAPTGPAGYEDVETYDPYDGYGSYEDEPTAYAVGGVGGRYQPTLADRFREAPAWFRLGAPTLIVLIVVVATAALAGGGSGDPDEVDTQDDGEVTLAEAIEIAYDAGFPRDVPAVELGGLIKSACAQVGKDDGAERVAAQVRRLEFDGDELSGAASGLREGGEAYCADAVEENDADFFRDVALALSGSTPSATSTTVAPSSTTIAEPTSTTKKSTPTTRKPTPTTKPKPSTTTTVPDSVPDEPDPETTTTAPATSTTGPGTDGGISF
ncbi:MAG: DUF2510 domain-containing protein [Actinomycetota bacterium]|nr:DUF2510 domain-containing protein [Actinomycetota bacterium]